MFINWLSGEKSQLVTFTHFGRIGPSIIAGFRLSTVVSLNTELESSVCVCVCVCARVRLCVCLALVR